MSRGFPLSGTVGGKYWPLCFRFLLISEEVYYMKTTAKSRLIKILNFLVFPGESHGHRREHVERRRS